MLFKEALYAPLPDDVWQDIRNWAILVCQDSARLDYYLDTNSSACLYTVFHLLYKDEKEKLLKKIKTKTRKYLYQLLS